MKSEQRPSDVRYIIGLCLVLVLGVFLRLPSTLFSIDEGGSFRALSAFHPAPGFTKIGFDEGLYRGYVNDLIRYGVTAYPDFAEHYVEVQTTLPSAILPPTRFLYIFASYLWHCVVGSDALASLHDISSLFGILLLGLATLFAWRLGGPLMALCVAALMACAPTQIHMTQHALIDGFFAFWATLCLWLLWENLRQPRRVGWLCGFGAALALLVVTKENAMFVYIGLLGLLAANHWLRFGTITRGLLVTMVIGPLVGVVLLVNLCGSLQTTFRIYMLLVSKASVLPYAIATGDGPWYRYLVDLMIMSPVVLVLAIGAIFQLKLSDRAAVYVLTFVVASYVLMANVRYGMNLRYANIWDTPLRYLATLSLMRTSDACGKRSNLVLALMIAVVCAVELRQYVIFFVEHDLYELVTAGLLHAINILK
ncbi:MAG: ArnT family glycosyltransferase [Chthoniobacterales bacterium]